MRCIHGRAATILITSLAFFAAGFLPRANAQSAPAARQPIGQAEINANDVYVRSGDSLNHYTIVKLKAGDKVTVVSERGEWYEILPPEGCFSLVSGDYVDAKEEGKGIINGANVRVRAGSLLNENKYTVQTLLNKGDEVTILGRNPDGFVRIKPPAAATLWINKSFASLGGEGHPASPSPTVAEKTSPAAPAESSVSTQAVVGGNALATPMTAKSGSKPAPVHATNPAADAQHRKLTELDAELSKEMIKAPAERNFDSFISRYRSIGTEASDEFVQQYAQRRIDELQTMQEAAGTIGHWKKIDEIAEAKRREFRTARAAIPESAPSAPAIEAKGELRISALFPPGGTPERYRLIDPSSGGERTIAYVEIPSGSNIQVNDFLNKFVGVRALERRVQTGGVNPIPIYIADDLVLLEPPDVQSNAQPSP